jgi:toxin CptA
VRKPAPSRLRITLGASRRLAVTLLAAHLLAALGVLASALPSIVLAALLGMLAASLAFGLRRHAWRASPASLVLLDLSDTLEVEAEDRAGRRLVGAVLGTTFVAPWLVVINMQVEHSRFARAVVIMPDATDHESFRAARVWLRWRRAQEPDR